MTCFSRLREKEVINTCDGRCLGFICDLEIDICDGRIISIIVPGPGRFMGIIRGDKDFVIPWFKIRKIGKDVILVDIDDTCLRKFEY